MIDDVHTGDTLAEASTHSRGLRRPPRKADPGGGTVELTLASTARPQSRKRKSGAAGRGRGWGRPPAPRMAGDEFVEAGGEFDGAGGSLL